MKLSLYICIYSIHSSYPIILLFFFYVEKGLATGNKISIKKIAH